MPKKNKIKVNKSKRIFKKPLKRKLSKKCGCKKWMSKRETKRFDHIMRVKVLK